MTAEKKLTAHNATVTTATVEIKTLTVSGRQVTLAVFRQLAEEPILDRATAEIAGDAWGRVNYHPDKCGDDPEHMHVVWQKGTELRRSTVQNPYAGHHKHWAADLYVRARIIHGGVHHPYADPTDSDILRLSERIPNGWRMFGGGRFTRDGMSFQGNIPHPLYSAWKADRQPTAGDREAFEEDVWLHGIPGSKSPYIAEHLLTLLPTRRYQQSWAELAALPQLFIAV